MSINTRLSDTKDIFRDGEPRAAYMFPEMVSVAGNKRQAAESSDETFVFQYWPESLDDTYNVEYAQKQVPGASHPLLQWIGGSGRQVTFTAQFTAEMDMGDTRGSQRTNYTRLASVGLMPSDRYTVDIRAALSRLRSFMMADYGTQASGLNSLASPPKKLWLVLEGSLLGGTDDAILVVLRSAPITYESWFPNGHPRMVQVSLTFDEIVQHSSAGRGQSSIKYIGRTPFEQDGRNYQYRGTVDRVLGQ